jgi:hypothetical protein
MGFLPDTNLWISLLKNPGGKLEAKVRVQPARARHQTDKWLATLRAVGPNLLSHANESCYV